MTILKTLLVVLVRMLVSTITTVYDDLWNNTPNGFMIRVPKHKDFHTICHHGISTCVNVNPIQ